ncbi:syntaxin-11-like [Lampris incognitus]|uniref:syntaxin-11-like n=1 Tax=Lampris incognitus TaxID=2546036 RepID=UPI0024B52E18|nr:syntaxin-11-like [Lampris incognitus]
MRDRLEMLQAIGKEQENHEPEQYRVEYDMDGMSLSHEAVVFESSPVIDSVLQESHFIRKEISLLRLEVGHLSKHNERFGTSTRRLTLLKQDSDSIARAIHRRGKALYSRLQALGTQSHELQEKEGPHAAVSRIIRGQYDSLALAFHSVMADYNEAEMVQRKLCRRRLQRQVSIVGFDISDKRLDVLVDKGGEGWAELSSNLQTEGGHSSRWALCEIKGRHRELVELETRLKEVHDLFLHMALLVEEQAPMLNNIEANMYATQEYVEKINIELKQAQRFKRKNPFLQCCPCLPCWSRVL